MVAQLLTDVIIPEQNEGSNLVPIELFHACVRACMSACKKCRSCTLLTRYFSQLLGVLAAKLSTCSVCGYKQLNQESTQSSLSTKISCWWLIFSAFGGAEHTVVPFASTKYRSRETKKYWIFMCTRHFKVKTPARMSTVLTISCYLAT